MEPPVIDQITHVPITGHFEPDLSTSGQSIIRVVLIVFVSVSILANALSIEALVLELLPNILEIINQFGCLQ